MKELLHLIWFEHYPRSPKYNVFDSSGFEHVFVGEHKRSKVNGFHSWVRLYLLEKEGNLDYMGYNHISEVRLIYDQVGVTLHCEQNYDLRLHTTVLS